MDNSKEFAVMLDKAISQEPDGFRNLDKTKNVQDQLQEMLSATHLLGAKIAMFHEFYEPEFRCPGEDFSIETSPCRKCVELGTYRRKTFTTMQQLQLAFVMSERFGKRWDNGKREWIKKGA